MNVVDYDKCILLYIVVIYDCVFVVKVLIVEGVVVNVMDRWGNLFRGEVESVGYLEMVKLFNDCGVEVYVLSL